MTTAQLHILTGVIWGGINFGIISYFLYKEILGKVMAGCFAAYLIWFIGLVLTYIYKFHFISDK